MEVEPEVVVVVVVEVDAEAGAGVGALVPVLEGRTMTRLSIEQAS